MTIKTLSEILAEMGEEPVSANVTSATVLDESNFYALTTTSPAFAKQPANRTARTNHTAGKPTKAVKQKSTKAKPSTTPKPISDDTPSVHLVNAENLDENSKTSTQNRDNKPAKKRKTHRQVHNQARSDTPQIASLLNDAKQGHTSHIITDKLADALANVSIEPIAITDRATNYMRWLAFYYLSNRELSRHELRTKLLAKDCNPIAVDALIEEFANKGYQSDERCAYMLIRESIRKGRGKIHIKDALKSAHIALPYSLDELIERADIDSLTDGTALADTACDEVDWLKLAVEARTRKYGDTIPTTPKDKAKQLRFLQYRGFEIGVCFDALKYQLSDLDECE
ncbi:recombination regulator RecX [Moraxella sp. FZFQ2102]|uniref:regulatory protein RecX n=1 Tax=Moraxella sp. FZFQ2102 TaxID=2953752 RepID=UPI00209C1991|nr:regulatory protein RecX [Moraxella sp. FZFQ2102]USZ14222.1 recombination regulator RecX [Moraxella sp. FZFQ2102]